VEGSRIGNSGEIYALLADMAARGEEGALATVIRTAHSAPRHSGSKMIVRRDGSVTGSVGGGPVEVRVIEAAREVMNDGVCRRVVLDLRGEVGVCGGETEVFVEPISVATPFWVVGAGHVGRAVLELGARLPFRFTVVDDRADFLADLVAARTICGGPEVVQQELVPTPRTAVLLVSHDHGLDGDYLEAAMAAEERHGSEVGYLGLMGSRTKAGVLARRFREAPQRQERFRRVRIPVGLAIGAETPAELALSILAEVLATLRGAPWLRLGEEAQGLYLQRTRPPSSAPAKVQKP
jgi:xanthine dehydrogenase accessory factor